MISVINFDIKRKVPLYAEITILYMIFYHTDLLTSFAIYFGFCHSLPMLILEFEEFNEKNIIKFYLKTLPFTILSLVFGLLLIYTTVICLLMIMSFYLFLLSSQA